MLRWPRNTLFEESLSVKVKAHLQSLFQIEITLPDGKILSKNSGLKPLCPTILMG